MASVGDELGQSGFHPSHLIILTVKAHSTLSLIRVHKDIVLGAEISQVGYPFWRREEVKPDNVLTRLGGMTCQYLLHSNFGLGESLHRIGDDREGREMLDCPLRGAEYDVKMTLGLKVHLDLRYARPQPLQEDSQDGNLDCQHE